MHPALVACSFYTRHYADIAILNASKFTPLHETRDWTDIGPAEDTSISSRFWWSSPRFTGGSIRPLGDLHAIWALEHTSHLAVIHARRLSSRSSICKIPRDSGG